MAILTRTQIDRLGDRLKRDDITEPDLRLLDDYRRSFSEPYETVVKAIRARLAMEPTGRPAKSTPSIAYKLRRESIRLSQMQDIAGCRLVVEDLLAQDNTVLELRQAFDQTTESDRRHKPSHGYRAVHVIVEIGGKAIEVQVRTSLQHLWAEQSEKLSDLVDPAIKYGGGDEIYRSTLLARSKLVGNIEATRQRLTNLNIRGEEKAQLAKELSELEIEIQSLMQELVAAVDARKK